MRNQSKNSAARSEVRSPASVDEARSGWKRLEGSRPNTRTTTSASTSSATTTIAISSGTGTPATVLGAQGGEAQLEPFAQRNSRLPAQLVKSTRGVDRDALHLARALGLE